jgi:carboxypeptidase PM20D1
MPLRMTKENTKRIHGIDERVGIENYKNAIRFYHQLLKNSCK